MMIETPRLMLCRPTNDDVLLLENLWRNGKVRQFLGGTLSDSLIIKQKLTEMLKHWDSHQFGQCVVFDRISKEILGLCGLHHSEDGVELTYMFFPEFWGKGFAREAATACLSFGFNTIKIKTIIAITQKENAPSCKLLLSIGMKLIKNFERFNALQCLFRIQQHTGFPKANLIRKMSVLKKFS